MKETIREEFVKCGKAGCKKCPHGPYRYAYWRENGKLRKRYLGKHVTQDAHTPPPPPPPPRKPHPWEKINFDRDASLTLACEILGVTQDMNREQCRKRYFHLAKKNHPDCGGENWLFVCLGNAWSYLRKCKGWS
jgi:hypothetical protein